jgi:hypothetical protein
MNTPRSPGLFSRRSGDFFVRHRLQYGPKSGGSGGPCWARRGWLSSWSDGLEGRANGWLRLRQGRSTAAAQPVWGCVGVAPLASSRSKPSGIDTIPGVVPETSVMPYCQTIESVAGSMTTTRLR